MNSVLRHFPSEGSWSQDHARRFLTAHDPIKAEVVKLCFFAGLTMPEIARSLNISLATEALEKPTAAERAAFLRSACAGDAKLLCQVERLLKAHANVGEFLNKPIGDPMVAALELSDATDALSTSTDCEWDGLARTEGEGLGDDQDDTLEFLQPSTRPDALGHIGHYEVLEVLGKGGFGIVFRDFDETLQRVVAIKVLSPQLAATSPARRRFLREARSSAKVRHENVVHVYAVEERPLPYLVMEFIPGETLQQRIDRTGPLKTPDVVCIGRQIALGLAAAHAQGLIHRDIEPGNIQWRTSKTRKS
jgi:eukaryotic-like serine/threonine-protein kinase